MISDQELLAAKSAAEHLREIGDEPGARAVDTLLRAIDKAAVPRLDYYTAPEAGQLLGVSGQTIKNWVSRGELVGYRIGHRIVIPKEAVEEYVRHARASPDLEDLTEAETASVVEEGQHKSTAPPPTLDDSIVARIRSVLKRHDVVRASAFGSVARGEATADSDLDLLVEFPPGKSLLDLVQLELDLTEVLGRKVDVVTFRSLHPLIRDRVLGEQVPVL